MCRRAGAASLLDNPWPDLVPGLGCTGLLGGLLGEGRGQVRLPLHVQLHRVLNLRKIMHIVTWVGEKEEVREQG